MTELLKFQTHVVFFICGRYVCGYVHILKYHKYSQIERVSFDLDYKQKSKSYSPSISVSIRRSRRVKESLTYVPVYFLPAEFADYFGTYCLEIFNFLYGIFSNLLLFLVIMFSILHFLLLLFVLRSRCRSLSTRCSHVGQLEWKILDFFPVPLIQC